VSKRRLFNAYSARSEISGSTLIARRAGIQHIDHYVEDKVCDGAGVRPVTDTERPPTKDMPGFGLKPQG
jgi:hypothetical protein